MNWKGCGRKRLLGELSKTENNVRIIGTAVKIRNKYFMALSIKERDH
jgi:hypothetical protein